MNAERDARAAGSTIEPIDPKDIIRILLFQALTGNYDWELRIFPDDIPDSHGLWNMKVVEADGNWIVFPYDYDLAPWVKSDNSKAELPDLADSNFFKPGDISQVVAEFKEKRSAIEALVDDLAKEDKSGALSIKGRSVLSTTGWIDDSIDAESMKACAPITIKYFLAPRHRLQVTSLPSSVCPRASCRELDGALLRKRQP